MSAQRTLSITRLYEDHIEKLKLSWVAAIGIERLVALGDQEVYGPDIVGHLNLIYSHRVQVIGKAEMLWAERVGSERWRRQIEDIMASRPPALIVADGLEVPADTLELCEATQTPLFTSPKPCSAVIDVRALYFLLADMADRFHLLKYGLAIVLVFIGGKMLAVPWFHIPIQWSLSIVGAIILISVILSLTLSQKDDTPTGDAS